MSVEPGISNQFTFIGGLNTEGGAFTQPPNTWKEGQNLIPQIDGALHRRYALDVEKDAVATGPTLTELQMQTWATSTFVIRGAMNNINANYIVYQKGPYLLFYKATEQDGSLSAGSLEDPVLHYNIDLNDYLFGIGPGNPEIYECQYAQVNGKLIVVNPALNPIVVSFDTDGLDVVELLYDDIKIRDFTGVDDELDIAERPGSLTDKHQYNLENQGWPEAKITAYQASSGFYPSNAQSWVYGKDSNDDFQPTLLDKQDFGTSLAPKGRKILSLLARARFLDNTDIVATDLEHRNFSTVASFSGRVWFSGLTTSEGSSGNTSEFGNAVFFSQVSDNVLDWGKFYQRADPTSEVFSDLADDDGGVIQIRDCGHVSKLVPIFSGMLVMADNGVWFIRGTTTTAFSAASYEVVKVADEGTLAPASIVSVDNAVVYFSRSGVNALTMDAGSNVIVSSLSDLSIKTFYNDIPANFRNAAHAAYNPDTKLISWLFGAHNAYTRDEILVYDLRLKCFYTHSMFGGFEPAVFFPYTQTLVCTEPFTDWDTQLSGIRTLKFFAWKRTLADTSLLQLVIGDMEGRVNFLNPNAWHDWTIANGSLTGVGHAFVRTGHDFGPTHPSARKHVLYIVSFMKNTETFELGLDENNEPYNKSSCSLATRWDFSTSAVSGKEPAAFEIYRWNRPTLASSTTSIPYSLVVAKSKVRGRGRALDLTFTSSSSHDMKLVGWSILWVGNTNA